MNLLYKFEIGMKIICDWDKCNEPGSYKAPVEKDNSQKIQTSVFKTHQNIFNKKWNYFENMNDEELNFIKSDLTWHKSNKKF